MKHAASISKEDEEEDQHSAKYPFIMAEDESKFVILEPFKLLGMYLFMQLLRFFSYLTPANLKKQINSMKEKTALELVIGFFKLIGNMFLFSSSLIYSIVRYCLRLLLRLMSGEGLAGSSVIKQEEEETDNNKEKLALQYVPTPSGSSNVGQAVNVEQTPTVKITPATDQKTESESHKNEENKEIITGDNQEANKLSAETKHDVKSTSKQSISEEAKKDEFKTATVEKPRKSFSLYEEEPVPENKSEQTTPALKSFNFNTGAYADRFICFLARNFYSFKNIALFIAFLINIMLLFYKISTTTQKDDESEEDGSGELMDDIIRNITDSAENMIEALSSEEQDDGSGEGNEDLNEEFVSIRDKFYYLQPILRFLAIVHSILSLCLILGYYRLKLPLAIFKREKKIARDMEFEGLYITDQNTEEQSKWDKIVISTSTFPDLYWDTFIKKRVRERYAEQFDYDSITLLLGMTNDSFAETSSSNENLPFWKKIIRFNKIDFKYQLWKAGVTITDQDFLYNFVYLVFSILGNINYFFFAAHLLDIAFVVKSLRTILQSVTHNGRQLLLTVVLLIIVVSI